MMNEISAFAAYTNSSSPKKAPNKSQKQIKNRKTKQAPKTSTKRALKPPKKTIKESPKKLNNGAGNGIKQNGVAHDKQSSNIAKMCSTSGSSSCGGSGSGSNSSFTELSNESSGDVDDLETTADMAKQMAKMVKKCAGGACNAGGASSDASDGSDASEDSDASDGSAASDDSDASDASDASDGSDNDDDSNDDDDEDEDDDAGDESDQFSVEYTPNSSNRSSSSSVSSPVAAKPPPPPPAAAARRKAQKRSGLLSDEETNDVNNNNNNKGKPQPAKQQKLQQIATELQKAPSCPLVRPAVAAAALVTGIVGAIKSCPLPSKETKKAAVKSCPLPAKTVDKMADKMAAKAKSCPLPKKNETTKLQQQQQQQRTVKQQQQQKPETVAKARRSLQAEPPKVNEVRRSLLAEPPKHKVQKGLEQSAHKEVHLQNSIEEGKRVLSWLLNPVMADTFFTQYWEKNACLVMRKRSSYFAKLISFKMIDELLIRHHLEFTTNIDVTSYENGVRQTHNPDGRATPPTVWGFYGDGCSIRILNPSTYLSSLRQVCTVLQEYFHCLVGANVYLTPPNSQGFAPHYDDIEAFVLQVEGRKRWRLYTPPLPSDLLGRVSSGNYKQEQLGEPIFDAVLEPGDILYFPRGTVHQAVTEEKQHSLHITLSVYQQQAYANLLEELLPSVLQRAIKHHLTLRRGLPLHTWQHLGLANGGQKSEQRTQLIQGINQMVQQYLMPHESQIDAAVDQLAKRFQHEALPPVVLPEEKLRTVFGSRSETDARGHCLADYELNERTEVRLLRAHILRLVAEGTSIRVYYYVDNALEYRKYEANYMEIQPTEAPAVEALIKAYPNYLKINELPLRSIDRRIEVATALWEHGLLMTKKPFKQ